MASLLRWIERWWRYRGVHVITCPENQQPAAVRVARTDLHQLSACSRWPALAGCDQACFSQLAAAPHACRLQALVAEWYEGKSCHYCTRPIGTIVWHERPPALLLDGRTQEWKDVAPQELPRMFATAQPVCWTCHLAETFRREHPERVVERPRPATPRQVLRPSVAVF